MISFCRNFAAESYQIVTILLIKGEVKMKKIEAIIRKTKFEDVKEALLAADIEWFS